MTIKQRLDKGEEARVMALGSMATPKLIEIAGVAGGFHGVWIDQEHSAIPHHEMELLFMACRAAGLDAFARVAPTDYGVVMRPMEAGASGVMIAQIRTVEQVKQVVEWAKYPPRGVRGLFMNNFESRYGTIGAREHVERANRERWLCIQIETPESVERADAIAAADGVDVLFVGSADLACTLGVPGEPMHPKCIAALERVSKACRAAGKPWGILARTQEHALKCRDLGCQLFSLAGDMEILHRGIKAAQQSYPDFF